MGAMTQTARSSRRSLLAAAFLTLAAGRVHASAHPRPAIVTVLGDSITAGLGLPAAEALPAQLQAALARRSVVAVVRGAGVSGDTTEGGLARLGFSVQPDTKLCVVELGANDGLQSIPPERTARNLSEIVARLRRRGITVVLLGQRAPQRASGDYGRAFDAVFPAVAHRSGAFLAPDALAGVETDATLKQADGLHPNARGVQRIVARLAPIVARALR